MPTVIQSVSPGYDTLRPWLTQTVNYHRVHVPTPPHVDGRLGAKLAKCRPWQYATDDVLIWVDGSIEPTSNGFVEHLLDESRGPLSQYTHPLRDCILDEAAASISVNKYHGQPVQAQVDHYMQTHPRHWGLWACGIIVYRPGKLYPLEPFGDAWLAEMVRWSFQDQISHAFLLNRFGLRPHTIPGNIFHMDHATIRPHNG